MHEPKQAAKKQSLNEGHGFSRAILNPQRSRALAPEVRLFRAFAKEIAHLRSLQRAEIESLKEICRESWKTYLRG
jgi:hypothetical protein